MMETYKRSSKHGGEVVIHTHCSLTELLEQVPGTYAYNKRMKRELEKLKENKENVQ